MTNSIPYTDYQPAHNDSQTYYKPDSIDPVANDHTQTNLKPDAIDTPVYEKPNAYEELDGQLVDELSVGMQETRLEVTTSNNQDEDDDGEEPIHTTIVRYKTRKTKMAPPPTESTTSTPTSMPPHTWSSSSLLSHVSSTATTTTTTTIQTEEDLLAQERRHHRPLSSTSLDQQAISPSVSTTSTINSTTSSTTTSTSKQMLLDSLKRRPMDDVAKYDIRKHSLVQPHHHDIYIGGTKKLLFRKRQPHSYSWGFQNILYRVDDQQQQHRLHRHGTKVAEARRRAFQKQITVEWGMDEKEWDDKSSITTTEDDASAYKGNGEQDGNDDDDDEMDRQDSAKSNHLINTNNTRLLFVYTTLFDNGYYIRWKRPSLVSHDMICEIRRVDIDDGNDKEEDSGSCCGKKSKKKEKKKWHLLAEFDSHGMGYLIHIGQLVVDKRALALVDEPKHLEAHVLITCCTLVDFMRELVQKAVGLSNGGVA